MHLLEHHRGHRLQDHRLEDGNPIQPSVPRSLLVSRRHLLVDRFAWVQFIRLLHKAGLELLCPPRGAVAIFAYTPAISFLWRANNTQKKKQAEENRHDVVHTKNKYGREVESRGFRKEKPTHGEYRRAVVRHGIELAPIDT